MWLPLAEYSMKHKVSISTLRRKIKASDIPYRLEEGKYLILESTEEHRPSLKSETSEDLDAETSAEVLSLKNLMSRPPQQTAVWPPQQMESATFRPPATPELQPSESVISAANRLLADLKKAYTQVLQDKELQIQNLKEEISDLKTLVKILESDNDRLRK